MKILLCFLMVSVIHATAFAERPYGDYAFLCTATDGDAKLQIDGDIDPSGAFGIFIKGSGKWKYLYRIYLAVDNEYIQDAAKLVSVPYEDPQIVIMLHWNKPLGENMYRGSIARKDLDNGQPLDVACTIYQ